MTLRTESTNSDGLIRLRVNLTPPSIAITGHCRARPSESIEGNTVNFLRKLFDTSKKDVEGYCASSTKSTPSNSNLRWTDDQLMAKAAENCAKRGRRLGQVSTASLWKSSR